MDSDTERRTDKEDFTRGKCINNDTVSLVEYEWVVNSDIEFIYVYGHAHIGTTNGVNAHIRTPSNTLNGNAEELLCASRPTYGDPESVDASFIIKMDVCDFNSSPHHVPKGSILRVSSEYNGLPAPFDVDEDGDGKYDKTIRFGAPYDGAMVYLLSYYTFSDLKHSQFSDVSHYGVNFKFFLGLGSGYFNNYYYLISSLTFASCLVGILFSIFYIGRILPKLRRHQKYHDKPT